MGMDATAHLLYGIVLDWDEVMFKGPVQKTCGHGHWYSEDTMDFPYCPRCGGRLERQAPFLPRPYVVAAWPEVATEGIFGSLGRGGVRFLEAGQIILDHRVVPTPLLLGKCLVTTNSHRTSNADYLTVVRRLSPQHDMDQLRERIHELAKPLTWDNKSCEFVVQVKVST